MISRNPSPMKHMKWAECKLLSELALIIDAVPVGLRVPLLRSALSFDTDGDFESSYFIGEVRSLIFDSLAQKFRLLHKPRVGLRGPDVDRTVERFTSCRDPAEVQLAVCDLLESVAMLASA